MLWVIRAYKLKHVCLIWPFIKQATQKGQSKEHCVCIKQKQNIYRKAFCASHRLLGNLLNLYVQEGLNFPSLRPSHVVFPKIGISRLFLRFHAKIGISAKIFGFQPPAGIWNPHKSAPKSLKMREIPIFAKSQYLEKHMGRAPVNIFHTCDKKTSIRALSVHAN